MQSEDGWCHLMGTLGGWIFAAILREKWCEEEGYLGYRAAAIRKYVTYHLSPSFTTLTNVYS